MKLVLMSCCAPCSCGAIAELQGRGADFCVLFYNPNIYPETEYQKRLAEQIKYCDSVGAKYHVLEYDHDAWLAEIKGSESEPEQGARCSKCFKHRFRRALQFATDNGYTDIASVLGVSKHKNQNQVDMSAIQAISTPTACAKNKVQYLPIKWNENLRQKINRETNFYRQKYCGCEFSIRDKK